MKALSSSGFPAKYGKSALDCIAARAAHGVTMVLFSAGLFERSGAGRRCRASALSADEARYFFRSGPLMALALFVAASRHLILGDVKGNARSELSRRARPHCLKREKLETSRDKPRWKNVRNNPGVSRRTRQALSALTGLASARPWEALHAVAASVRFRGCSVAARFRCAASAHPGAGNDLSTV